MLEFTALPASPGTSRRLISGYCHPGRFAADARAHFAASTRAKHWAPRSRSADFIPLLLLALLAAYSALAGCTTSRAAPEAHNVRAEKAAPAHHARYEWANGDD
ncbi:hypothetical protein KB206_10840 [Microvirga sp. STS02]|uniref:hypothetical protein n=1 Tax=Hymenobacter negativus TaxID=2795026 RepID=UPI0018DDB9C4|nr:MULTISPECIES: hypothetical protein [Bacteria]MBH8569382.1 hypothetical protein [Hymenobacter negativus]MBR7209117.1 hypothetical protein [Microvirga sp. STS02]